MNEFSAVLRFINGDYTKKLFAYLQLLRPANIVTAVSDIMAGFAISGYALYLFEPGKSMQALVPLGWLILSTIGLYGGGVVFNDVFDAELDKTERPERPVPRGDASLRGAILLGSIFFSIGILFAFFVNTVSGIIALLITLLALLYDKFSKHHRIAGPLNMGMCRGLNLLLGLSVLPFMIRDLWFVATIPLIYISAITMISRGEVHGGSKKNILKALLLFITVIVLIQALNYLPYYNLEHASVFLLLFTLIIVFFIMKALRQPAPENIRKAVGAGIISLIIMNAAISAGFAGLMYGFAVLLLLPVSLVLAKLFAVT